MFDLKRLQRCRSARALALWLVAVQLVLFTASGVLHVHAAPAGSAVSAAHAAVGAAGSANGERIAASGETRPGLPSSCVLCQMARTAAASLETTSRVTPLAASPEPTPVWSPVAVPSYLSAPRSSRAPPTL